MSSLEKLGMENQHTFHMNDCFVSHFGIVCLTMSKVNRPLPWLRCATHAMNYQDEWKTVLNWKLIDQSGVDKSPVLHLITTLTSSPFPTVKCLIVRLCRFKTFLIKSTVYSYHCLTVYSSDRKGFAYLIFRTRVLFLLRECS